jgi:hypothetical protein
MNPLGVLGVLAVEYSLRRSHAPYIIGRIANIDKSFSLKAGIARQPYLTGPLLEATINPSSRKETHRMRKHLLSGALVAAGLLVALSGAQAQNAIKWKPSFKAAMAAAKTGDKLVMVDFYTEW